MLDEEQILEGRPWIGLDTLSLRAPVTSKKLYKYRSAVQRKCQDRAIISDVIKILIVFEIVGMREFDQVEREEYGL